MVERHWVVATRVALAVVGAILVVLVVTGVLLAHWYRPDVTAAYATLERIPASASWTRRVHRVAAGLFLPAVVGLAIAAAGLALVRHRAARVGVPIAVGIFAVAASFTGYLLPWDQLAFRSVTVGKSISGYGDILFNKNVKYVLVLVVLLVVIGRHTRAARPRDVTQ